MIALILSPLLHRHQSRLMSFNDTLRSNIGLAPVESDRLKLGLQGIAQHLGCASRSGRSSIDFGNGAADAPDLRGRCERPCSGLVVDRRRSRSFRSLRPPRGFDVKNTKPGGTTPISISVTRLNVVRTRLSRWCRIVGAPFDDDHPPRRTLGEINAQIYSHRTLTHFHSISRLTTRPSTVLRG